MDPNHDIVPTLRMFDGLMTGKAADEIERLRNEAIGRREGMDRLLRRARRRYFDNNPPNTWLATVFNELLQANGTFEQDHEANARREAAANGAESPRSEVMTQQAMEVTWPGITIRVKRELFKFQSQQEWVNKAKSWYANCGVRQGFYLTVDAHGHVMHMGKCFTAATERGLYPVTVYELQTNWAEDA